MLEIITFIVAIILQCLDVYSTNKALASNPKAIESNPFIDWLMRKAGDKWGALKLLITIPSFGYLCFYSYEWSIWLAWGINLLYMYVVYNNMKIANSR